jgi:hypothetical protein
MAQEPGDRFASAEEMMNAILEAGTPATAVDIAAWVKTVGAEYLERAQAALTANEEGRRESATYKASDAIPPRARSTVPAPPSRSPPAPTLTAPTVPLRAPDRGLRSGAFPVSTTEIEPLPRGGRDPDVAARPTPAAPAPTTDLPAWRILPWLAVGGAVALTSLALGTVARDMPIAARSGHAAVPTSPSTASRASAAASSSSSPTGSASAPAPRATDDPTAPLPTVAPFVRPLGPSRATSPPRR